MDTLSVYLKLCTQPHNFIEVRSNDAFEMFSINMASENGLLHSGTFDIGNIELTQHSVSCSMAKNSSIISAQSQACSATHL